MSKPSIPKGTRDFLPEQVAKRDYIFGVIKAVFLKYGYNGISTPVMENLSTLTGKYGDEGDQLLFKVLNNGDYLSKANPEALASKDSAKLTSSISKRGLRYDLTVPFARYVVMHQNDIQLPFKRYAIEPVWRADRPQKGRYQEFYQCDADFVGTNSLMCEAELVTLIDEVFTKLKIPVVIKVNNRKVLMGIAEVCGMKDHFMAFTVAIDKLDKIGKEKVSEELQKKGLEKEGIDRALGLIETPDLNTLESALQSSEIGLAGIAELRQFHDYLDPVGHQNEVALDATLARGLNYYTGCIFEVKAKDVVMGSITGGGRYDDLTGVFGLKGVSGVGISFGAERIYDVMEELNLFPSEQLYTAKSIILAMDGPSHKYGFQLVSELRAAGISVDMYPDPAKFKKQIKYANQGGYPFVIIIGEEEMASGKLTLKNMESGDQSKVTKEELITMWTKDAE